MHALKKWLRTPASGNPKPLVPITPAPTSATEFVLGIEAGQIITPSLTPTSDPTITRSAAVCTGGAESKEFFAISAGRASFDVYCAVLPATWLLQKGNYYWRGSGDFIDVFYKGPGSSLIELQQGAQCTASAATCSFRLTTIGTTAFASLSGELGTYGSTSTPDYVIYVDPGTNHGYTLIGKDVTKAEMVAFAAAMTRVAKG